MNVLKRTRRITEDAFEKSFEEALDSKERISEKEFAKRWLAEIGKSSEVFPQGWYQPPPAGIGVLFATDEDTERISFRSLRYRKYWPRDDVFLECEKGLIMVYFSAVERNTG